MTLVLNEIHTLNGFEESFIIAAADRRLSKPDGSYYKLRKKLFPIPYLRGAISYYGLAVFSMHNNRKIYMSDYLINFIRKNTQCNDLKSFSQKLRNDLVDILPRNILKNCASGFHICGYNNNGIPDFWSFSNLNMTQDDQTIVREVYNFPYSDFLERDAKEQGWNGSDKNSVQNHVRTYRNGDIRAHVSAWSALDSIFTKLTESSNFIRPTTPEEYGAYVKCKFEIIAYLYKKLARNAIIGRPIDVLVLRK